ncbi:MAP7 domain-containing protein 3 isoform X3 [Callithrix jacchus]|uniref:MAP7 domain containing 3 n=1 Tax=Callithrix jacchus TaxID=9483 RepID=A0A8I4A434_CALJA|nr:MAP7 domain-containing protein 3 isoform X3 [Callithrix jacchus]
MADRSAAGAGGSTSLREMPARKVIYRSILKNDEKRRLAGERRKEKKRQQANKETQLLEKERQTKLRCQQQTEVKMRKYRERQEKDERRRRAAEEKRHQKDEALKEQFRAILQRTLERRRLTNEYQQKRWSWGVSAMVNSENKTANKRSLSTEKLEKGPSFALNRQIPLTSEVLETCFAKRKTNKEKNLSLNKRNTKAHSSADTEQVEKKPGGGPKYVTQYVTMPLRKCTSDELRAFMFRISAAKIPPQTKVEVPSEEVEAPPKTPPKSMDAPSPGNIKIISNRKIEAIPKFNFYMDTIREKSIDLSPVVSGDVSSVMSTTDSEWSTDTSSKLSIEAASKVHLRTVPKKSETDLQALDRVPKKHLSSYGECYTSSFSPENVCAPPSPVSSKSQIQKNQLSSPLPKQSKQSADPSLPCKMPLQWDQFVQSESSADKNKKESKSDKKNTVRCMNDEIEKLFARLRRRIARRLGSREEEEELEEEMQPRAVKKSKDVEKKEAELLEAEEFLKPEDGQQQKETEEKKGWPDQEDQETPLQEWDTKIKAQEEDNKYKKEVDRIMLQNLKEHLGRKKRIEEIIKWMGQTDVNASKVTETPCHDTYEEAEATSEESDTDSLNEIFLSGTLNGKDPSSKLKKSIKNVKKMPPKLVFLQDSDIQVHKEPKTYFNRDLKTFRPKRTKYTSTQAVISRPSTKRMTSRTTKIRKADETNTTNRSSPQTKSGGFHDNSPKSSDTFRRQEKQQTCLSYSGRASSHLPFS